MPGHCSAPACDGPVMISPMHRVDTTLAARLHDRARASRWQVSVEAFGAALERSAAKSGLPAGSSLERYLSSLHLEDLALACACAGGHDEAWEHFVREFRPVLYRAADAMAPGGGARDVADALYAELYGVSNSGEARTSLLTYFHGRSSLATWLRAVLSQRVIDRARTWKRLSPLPEDESALPAAPPASASRCLERVMAALKDALARLDDRDRLRLGWYHAQQMTLAAIGKALGEHEATVSRQLTRARKQVRAGIETALTAAGLSSSEIDDCMAEAAADPGTMDVGELLGSRKIAGGDRSFHEEPV